MGQTGTERFKTAILLLTAARLVAGAMSMAAGEYVPVSSQTDAEQAVIARETWELRETPAAELEDLTGIHVARGSTGASPTRSPFS